VLDSKSRKEGGVENEKRSDRRGLLEEESKRRSRRGAVIEEADKGGRISTVGRWKD
jgi:hypothetical protein